MSLLTAWANIGMVGMGENWRFVLPRFFYAESLFFLGDPILTENGLSVLYFFCLYFCILGNGLVNGGMFERNAEVKVLEFVEPFTEFYRVLSATECVATSDGIVA